MKNFFEGVLEWKTWAALCFSGAVVIYLIVALALGETEVSISGIFSLLIISTGGTFFQYLAFGPRMIKKLHYTWRMVIFGLPFIALLSANAYFFQWFPMDQGGYWLAFIGMFLFAFLFMTLGFEIYFKMSGKKYDGLLGQYRQRLEEREKK